MVDNINIDLNHIYLSSTDYETCVLYKATFQSIRQSYPYHSPLALLLLALRLGCAVFTPFFICFEAILIEYESYTLPIRMFVYIHIVCFIFASSHRFAYKYLILYKKIHVAVNLCFRANIHLICSHTGKFLVQNIRKLYANFTFKQIFACKYLHTSEYSLHIASNYLRKPFSSLGPHLILGSF